MEKTKLKRWKKDGKHKKTSKKQKNTYKNLQITQKRWKKNGNTQWKKINKKNIISSSFTQRGVEKTV